MTWPASLPPPLVAGYSVATELAVAAPDLGAGWGEPFSRTPGAAQRASLSMILDGAQRRDLAQFLRNSGHEWFTISLRLPGNSDQVTPVLARLIDEVAFAPAGLDYDTASFDVEMIRS